MYRQLDDFFKDWEFESSSTLKILNALDQGTLDQRVNDVGRSLRQLAWHIATTHGEMLAEAGLTIDAASHILPPPEDLSTIIESYTKGAAAVAAGVRAQWSDEKLTDSVQMYGSTWRYGDVLTALISHEIHHRGQMTVLMRQAGLKVPGVYGPAREEWATMGMEAPAW